MTLVHVLTRVVQQQYAAETNHVHIRQVHKNSESM